MIKYLRENKFCGFADLCDPLSLHIYQFLMSLHNEQLKMQTFFLLSVYDYVVFGALEISITYSNS